MKRWIIAAAAAAGTGITWLDTRPGWDDAGISVLLILGATGILGAAAPKHAWLTALIVGAGIPLTAIIENRDYGMVLVFLIAFAGAYGGALLRWLIEGFAANQRL